MNSQAAGAIGAICMLLLWSFVIWPAIKRSLGKAATIAGDKFDNALRPSADSAQILVMATPKAQSVFKKHTQKFESDWERIDTCVRKSIEAQMMVVCFSASLLNISIQDAAYDLGLVDPFKMAERKNGFPKIKISDDAFRAALKTIWSSFSPATRANLDMRYRYMFVQRLNSDIEEQMIGTFQSYAVENLKNEFAYGASSDRRWLELIIALSSDNDEEAVAAFKRL